VKPVRPDVRLGNSAPAQMLNHPPPELHPLGFIPSVLNMGISRILGLSIFRKPARRASALRLAGAFTLTVPLTLLERQQGESGQPMFAHIIIAQVRHGRIEVPLRSRKRGFADRVPLW
jgi:hypothetical protein